MVALETMTNQYLGGDAALACSPKTQSEVDKQVVELVRTQRARATELLKTHRDALERLAGYLYDNETITGEEFMNLLNEKL